jgi:hypothetical protein
MDFANKNNREQVQRRLTETIAWCALQDWSSNPAEKLRSPTLRPPEITDNVREIFARRPPLEHAELMATENAEILRQWREETARLLAIENAETKRQWQQNVEQLAIKRATFLQAQDLPLLQLRYPLAGGRLLVYNPDESTSDGVAHDATQGFITGCNEPAWDTWIAYVMGDSVSGTPYYHPFDSYLLSWVPDPLIEMVQGSMDRNSDDCHHWVNGLDSAFIRQLRQAALIR